MTAALQIHYATLSGAAVAVLASCVMLVGMAMNGPSRGLDRGPFSLRPVRLAALVGAIAGVMVISVVRLAAFVNAPIGVVLILAVAVGVLAFAHIASSRLSWIRVALVVGVLLLGGILIAADDTAAGRIDVYVFQDLGARYLLAGENPYGASYPNVYSPEETELFYGPGLADESEVVFGFPYMPLSLLLALPGHIIAGDFRYSQLIAIAMAILWMSSARYGFNGRLAASLLAVYPLGYHVIVGGWTEPLQVLVLMAAVIAFLRRQTVGFPVLFGLLIASKLTLIVLVPLYLVFDRAAFGTEGRGKRLLWGVLSAAVVTLPLALWDLPRFWFSVVELQFLQPFRPDALSALVWLGNNVGSVNPALAVVVPMVAAGAGIWWAWRRASPLALQLTASMAFTYLIWLMFTKQSFLNHYYFGVGTLVLAISVASESLTGTPISTPDEKASPCQDGGT